MLISTMRFEVGSNLQLVSPGLSTINVAHLHRYPDSDEDDDIEKLMGQADCTNGHLPLYIAYYTVTRDQIFRMTMDVMVLPEIRDLNILH